MKRFSFCVLLLACGGARTVPQTTTASTSAAPDYAAIVAATDRTEDDRALDAHRHPAELLAFMGVRPGMRVADLGAGGGYTTELLARAVGPTGKVWAQNDPTLVEKFLGPMIAARLARPADKNVIRVDRSFDSPLPPDATNLDLVSFFIFYHDTVWIGADRDKMNKAVFDALKPGGAYVIVDSSAKPGDGTKDAQTLHRIDEATVKSEVEKAGFTLERSADFLRNPADARDWSSSPRAAGDKRGTEDRFVLKLVKPR
ncbi:MAG TPA: SAM-dependent methyltransferase [Polyangiaceae bacterium]|jgi:predicted methyltransferase